MPFVLQTSGSYRWPMVFDMPIDGGRYRRETLELEFRRLPQSRVEEITAVEVDLQHAIRTGADNMRELMGTARIHASEIVCGWSGILECDGGDEIPFSKSALDQLLEIPGMASLILQTYQESFPKAKAKNSQAPQSSGS